MKALRNPVVITALGLALGVATGLGVFWQAALPLVREAHASRFAAAAARPDKPWDFWTLEIENLSAELKDEQAALAAREAALAAREERVLAERRELEKTRSELAEARAEVLARLTEIEATESKNLKTLAKTYSELSPRAAVAILRELDETTAVKILHLMKTDVVSPILQEMGASTDPELARRAAKITDRLRLVRAGANGPTA